MKGRPQPKSRPKSKSRPKKLDKDAVGIITHYFPHVRAAVFKAEQPLNVGDMIKIKGHTTDFMQKVASMQIDRTPITVAKKGDEIGLQVESRVRRKDIVYKL
ncbi:MAG: translation elongation factor-like protein [Candidatus Omnitrophica bacterium]|nr:translation elongation factor-like protein [Candidatus Omnitrophota bacterium]